MRNTSTIFFVKSKYQKYLNIYIKVFRLEKSLFSLMYHIKKVDLHFQSLFKNKRN